MEFGIIAKHHPREYCDPSRLAFGDECCDGGASWTCATDGSGILYSGTHGNYHCQRGHRFVEVATLDNQGNHLSSGGSWRVI